jgi:hypothetical protein
MLLSDDVLVAFCIPSSTFSNNDQLLSYDADLSLLINYRMKYGLLKFWHQVKFLVANEYNDQGLKLNIIQKEL